MKYLKLKGNSKDRRKQFRALKRKNPEVTKNKTIVSIPPKIYYMFIGEIKIGE